MARLTWHGHSCFSLESDDGARILFDPFLSDNPVADIGPADIAALDFILCSHGHFDHFADAISLAKQTGATIIGTYELVSFAQSRGVANGHGMNIGGGHQFPFGYLKLTPALHSGTIHGDEAGTYTTSAAGFWIDLGGDGTGTGKKLYFAGDTALIMEMQLLNGMVDVALLPIGDNFTMGPRDAVRAIEFIAPRVVVPMHYDTWELIAQDTDAFRRSVRNAEVVVLNPGSAYTF
jgi:L-ascorbate metabolism protein UlaG (beta-lactamase superfamily)